MEGDDGSTVRTAVKVVRIIAAIGSMADVTAAITLGSESRWEEDRDADFIMKRMR